MENTLLQTAVKAACGAGERILGVYGKDDFKVEVKGDDSPLTEADRRSHEVIKEALEGTGLPVLSEEGKQLSFAERKGWHRFWMVDPLDGTKEFIKRNGEFTVNIALVEGDAPVLGVVYVPVTGVLYWGTREAGSFKTTLNAGRPQDGLEEKLKSGVKLPENGRVEGAAYTVVASRSHMSPETEAFIEEKRQTHGEVELISSGSSLKLCLVAEGRAQVYPRLAPTMEWDTAAAHAVARYAGCKVIQYETGQDLVYNKEDLLNPWFVVEQAG